MSNPMTQVQLDAVCTAAGEVIVSAALERWKQRSPETFRQQSLHWGVRQALARAVPEIVEAADEARLAAEEAERPAVFFSTIAEQAVKVMDQELERIAAALAMVERRGATQH